MKKILITGATGFIGSHLAAAFMEEGKDVIVLARSKGNQSGWQRMQNRFHWFQLNGSAHQFGKVIEADISRPQFGLSNEAYRNFLNETSEIIHCAADTSFSDKVRSNVEMANLEALKHVLKFANEASVNRFHLVSTAFVCPTGLNICKEEIVDRESFLNVYEETKYKAEKEVKRFCELSGIPWKIYRPSIVYGNSLNGKTFRFNGLYYPIKTLYLLKKVFAKDLENGGTHSQKLGVYKDINGRICFPIELETQPHTGINLIPIDYFVETFLALYNMENTGRIHHITNPHPSPLEVLLEYTSRYFELTGITTSQNSWKPEEEKNAMEKLFHSYLGEYNHYLTDDRIFDTSKTDQLLQSSDIHCPHFDYPLYKKIIDYAIKTNWGKALSLD